MGVGSWGNGPGPRCGSEGGGVEESATQRACDTLLAMTAGYPKGEQLEAQRRER